MSVKSHGHERLRPGGGAAARSHLADVVVDGVCVPLARRVARRLEHTVLVPVDLGHRHFHAVRVVVWRLRSVRRDGLRTETLVTLLMLSYANHTITSYILKTNNRNKDGSFSLICGIKFDH